jgi:periplasmic divalent cation tolerance protein
MGNENDHVLIYTTFSNVDEAKKVGRILVEAHLAACTNILPSMTSIYEW